MPARSSIPRLDFTGLLGDIGSEPPSTSRPKESIVTAVTEPSPAPKKKPRRRRLIIGILVVVGIIALVIGIIGPPPSSSGASQLTTKVTRGDVSLTVDASGQVVDEYTYSIAPETAAVLSAIAGVPTGATAGAGGFTTSSVDVSVGDAVTDGQQLASVRNGNDDTYSVTSPQAGTVRSITTATDAAASQVATLGVGAVVVAVQVSEYDVADIAVDQVVTLTLGSSDQDFDGTVSRIAQVSTNTTGVEQYQVVITSDQLPETARIGMTATASIVVDSRTDVVVVAPTALTKVGAVTVATIVAADGTSTTRPVQVGLVGNTTVEITSGLNAGDTVVIGSSGDVPVVDTVVGPPGFGG
jgi:multidrug efflux pump subunit AcrA (membrane-fusion protein)